MLPDKNSYQNLGGEIVDYSAVVDPTTDLGAAQDDDARADVAAMTRTAIRAYVTFTATTSPTPTEHDAVWGNADLVAPTIIRSSAGVFIVTWPASVVDARGITHSVNLRVGWANGRAGGSVATRLGPTSFQVDSTEPYPVTVFVL